MYGVVNFRWSIGRFGGSKLHVPGSNIGPDVPTGLLTVSVWRGQIEIKVLNTMYSKKEKKIKVRVI